MSETGEVSGISHGNAATSCVIIIDFKLKQ